MSNGRIIRVFARRTKFTPTDDLAFYGGPPLYSTPELPVYVSVTFTWDIARGRELADAWRYRSGAVRLGGPAFGIGRPGEFVPGRFLKEGITITSRGCPNRCPFCLVPDREGKIRELTIRAGSNVADNNLLACSRRHVGSVFEMLRTQRQIRFSGGLEAARVTDEIVEELRGLRIKFIWLAYDNEDRKRAVLRAVERLKRYFTQEKIRCYALIGYHGDTLDAAEGRLRWLYEIGTFPYAMQYRLPVASFAESFLQPGRAWRDLAGRWKNPRDIKGIMKREKGYPAKAQSRKGKNNQLPITI